MIKEFMDFLKSYGVIGLAIAVVIGGKVNALVTAVVENVIMPLVSFVLPAGNWREAAIALNDSASIGYGEVMGVLIDFLVVAFLVFWFAKKVMKEEAVEKK